MPYGACVASRRFKKRHSDDRFRKPTFFDARKRRLRVDERLKGGKNFRFQKYRDTCFLKQIPSWILAMTCYANHVMK